MSGSLNTTRSSVEMAISISIMLVFGWLVQAQTSLTPRILAAEVSVPGVVVDHTPKTAGIYVGSPSLAILSDGTYVASHDEFGPQSTERTCAKTRVFASSDRGQTWRHLADVNGQFWSSLFVHRGDLYLLGTWSHYGNLVIRRSSDGGRTWSEPQDAQTGLLREGRFHCAPVPIVSHAGRIWRAVEDTSDPARWGLPFRARVLSASEDGDLLRADSWVLSEPLAGDPAWLEKQFNGFLEGNMVLDPAVRLFNILRVDLPHVPEKAAMVLVSEDGRQLSFAPDRDFIDLPGGAKKFTIRYDPLSKYYWSLTNVVPKAFRNRKPASVRNTLALVRSRDLRQWEIRCALLHHPDPVYHGFQYPDWVFDEQDIVAAVRTAYDDSAGGAHNAHDANYLTFHRFQDFREMTWDKSVLPREEFLDQ